MGNRVNMSADQQQQQAVITHPVECNNLPFRYDMSGPTIIDDLTLEPGSRCLLVGSNVAGKSTLLNVFGGKHLHNESAVKLMGQTAFSNTHPGVTVLSGQWSRTMVAGAGSTPYQNDVSVQDMLDQRQGETEIHQERLNELLHILDVNLTWRMHVVSDGQRRRVQILMALLRPFDVLLLDEVTVDLDVLARARLLNYLVKETETRGATILYATHIFDGLDGWATHLAHLALGAVKRMAKFSEIEELDQLAAAGSPCPLLGVIESWLRAEREAEIALRATRKVEAPKKDLKLSTKKSKYDPFGANRMYNYW